MTTENVKWYENEIERQAMYIYHVTLRRVHKTNVALEKKTLMYKFLSVSALLGVGVGLRAQGCTFEHVALLIKHARRMRSAASLSPPNFSTLPHERHDFRKKKVTEHKMF